MSVERNQNRLPLRLGPTCLVRRQQLQTSVTRSIIRRELGRRSALAKLFARVNATKDGRAESLLLLLGQEGFTR